MIQSPSLPHSIDDIPGDASAMYTLYPLIGVPPVSSGGYHSNAIAEPVISFEEIVAKVAAVAGFGMVAVNRNSPGAASGIQKLAELSAEALMV